MMNCNHDSPRDRRSIKDNILLIPDAKPVPEGVDSENRSAIASATSLVLLRVPSTDSSTLDSFRKVT